MAIQDLSSHNQPDDAWIAIEGTVYDVSSFLQIHPGGAKRLLDSCGGDATAAFAEAGHSGTARSRLKAFAIGQLILAPSISPGGGRRQGQKQDLGQRGGETDPFLSGPPEADGLYETLKVYIILGRDPFLLALFAQIWAAMCMFKFLKSMVLIEALNLTFASTSFVSNLSLSFQASLSVLLLGNVMLTPLALLPLNVASIVPSWSEWRTHLSAVSLLLLLYAECTAMMMSFAHKSTSTHFYRMTLFGTFAVELLCRWLADSRNGSGINRWMCWRQPFPAFAFACTSVFLDAYSFQLISPTCGQSFFFSNCKNESDKQQTFLCLVFMAVVFGRSVYSRCLGDHIAHHSRNSYATTQNICLLAAVYGCLFHFYVFENLNPFHPFQKLSASMVATRYGATFFAMLSLVLTTALTAWSNPHFALQARMLSLGLVLWVFSPPIALGRWFCPLFLGGALVNLSEESRVLLLKKAPVCIMAAKSLEECIRLYATVCTYHLLVRPVIYLLSILAPEGLVRRKTWLCLYVYMFACLYV